MLLIVVCTIVCYRIHCLQHNTLVQVEPYKHDNNPVPIRFQKRAKHKAPTVVHEGYAAPKKPAFSLNDIPAAISPRYYLRGRDSITSGIGYYSQSRPPSSTDFSSPTPPQYSPSPPASRYVFKSTEMADPYNKVDLDDKVEPGAEEEFEDKNWNY